VEDRLEDLLEYGLEDVLDERLVDMRGGGWLMDQRWG
jgi:hypothetical protein